MTRLKDITFESGSLTGTNGADNTSGSPSIDSNSVLKGTYSARINLAATIGLVIEDITATDTVYISAYLRIATMPDANTQVIQVRTQSGTNLAAIQIRTNSRLRLINGGSTLIGSDQVIATNTTYRIGIRYTKGTGANAILEFYLATGDDAFGSAVASSTTETATAQTDRLRFGAPSATTTDFYLDNIRIDDASMPTDDVAGNTQYTKTVNVSVSKTVTIVQKGKKSLAISATNTVVLTKKAKKSFTLTVSKVVTNTLKGKKPITITVANTVTRSNFAKKIIAPVVNSSITITKKISHFISVVVSNTINDQRRAKISINISAIGDALITRRGFKSINITRSITVALRKMGKKQLSSIVSHSVSLSAIVSGIITNAYKRFMGTISIQRRNTGNISMRSDTSIISIRGDIDAEL